MMEDFEKTVYSAVLGLAGVGKSWLLKKVAAESNGAYVLCSTTGISAINLGAGQTIHSLLWFYNTASLLDSFTTGRLDYRLGEVYNTLGIRRLLCDECFVYNQHVLTENGYEKIGVLVNQQKNVRIWSLNRSSNKLELKRIKRWIKRPAPNDVLEIDASRTNSKRGQRTIRCTEKHKVLTPTGYKYAGELVEGDPVVVNSPGYTKLQRGVIVGSIFGDGHLTKKNDSRSSRQLKITHGEAQLEYLKDKAKILGLHAGAINEGKSGYGTKKIFHLSVNTSDTILEFSNEMVPYKRQGRTYWNPTQKLIDQIDEISLAFWFLDDGSISWHKRKKTKDRIINSAQLHLPPFYDRTITDIISYIQRRFKLIVVHKKDKKGNSKLYFGRAATEKLLSIISLYCPISMNYKVPEATLNIPTETSSKTSIAKIRTIRRKKLEDFTGRNTKFVYDLEIKDNHNYIAGNIIVSNCSMMPAENLSIICMAIDRLNDALQRNGKPLFGLTISGDFYQLPPIDGEFAFESEYWDSFAANTTILRKIHRQTDPEFIQALQWVREGEGKLAAEYFRDKMHRLVDPKFEGTTIYPYNANVDRQNQYRLEKVEGEVVKFESYRSGKPRTEWKHIPDKLVLKINSLVMILANKYLGGEINYCNGDLGTVISVEPNLSARVLLQRNNEIVDVDYISRNNEAIVRGEKRIVGNIRYLPLRLAYSSTIDKSQSLTLDSVQVDIRAKFYRERIGLLYTALSRVRTKAGLRIIGSPKTFIQNCVVNPKLKRFL